MKKKWNRKDYIITGLIMSFSILLLLNFIYMTLTGLGLFDSIKYHEIILIILSIFIGLLFLAITTVKDIVNFFKK